MVFIDYKMTIATNTDIKNYIKYTRSFLTENIVTNAQTIQDNLLENTECFVVVPKNIDTIEVTSNSMVYHIPSMQSFIIYVYVDQVIYLDNNIRDTITYNIISAIDSYLYSNTQLVKTELLNILYTELKDYIKSISIDKFTQLNSEYIVINELNSRLSLNKKLTTDATGYTVAEDVTVNFVSSVSISYQEYSLVGYILS